MQANNYIVKVERELVLYLNCLTHVLIWKITKEKKNNTDLFDLHEFEPDGVTMFKILLATMIGFITYIMLGEFNVDVTNHVHQLNLNFGLPLGIDFFNLCQKKFNQT